MCVSVLLFYFIVPCTMSVRDHGALDQSAALAEISLMQLGLTVDIVETRQRDTAGKRQGSHDAAEVATNAGMIETLSTIGAPALQSDALADSPTIFIGVMTALANAKRRSDVRASWINHEIVKNRTVQYKFVVGEPDPHDPVAVQAAHEAQREEAVFNDFLHLPLIDTYSNLTLKTIEFFKWFSSSRPESFVMKLDDDSFPHFDLLVPHLRDEAARYTYFGLFAKCEDVPRVGELAESYEQMPGKYLPVHANGPAYVMSGTLAKELTITYPEPKNRYKNEGVTVGAWMIEARASVPVEYRPLPSTWSGCHGDDVFSQNLAEGRLQCIWSSGGCCDEPRFTAGRVQFGRAPTGVVDFSLRGVQAIMGGDLNSDSCPSYAGPSATTLKSLALSNLGLIAALIIWRQWQQRRQMQVAGSLLAEPDAPDRSALLDNAKCFAQFMVIYNHIFYWSLLYPTKDMETIMSGGGQLIFDMRSGFSYIVNPFFCFISGVVSQGSPTSKRVVRYVQYLVIPTYIWHFVLQPLFVPAVRSLDPRDFLVTIQSYSWETFMSTAEQLPPWYLLALCLWRGSVYLVWSHMRPATAFVGMIAVACIGGYFELPTKGAEGFNAAVAYFPHFAAGYICPFPALVRAVPKPGVLGSVMALLAAIVHMFVIMPSIFPANDGLPDGHDWYGSERAFQLNFQYAVPWDFWLWWSRRLAKFAADMVAPMLLLFFVVPRAETPLTYIGSHTLYSYLFHMVAIGSWKGKLLTLVGAPVVTSSWGHALVLLLYVPFALLVLVIFTSSYFRALFGWALTPKWLNCVSDRLVSWLERRMKHYEDAREARGNECAAGESALGK